MVLSAALDSGYVFITLIAILTSVIGAIYYLNIIKEIFFDSPEYKLDKVLDENSDGLTINPFSLIRDNKVTIISSPFSITISIITLVILLFIFMNKE